MRDTEVEWENFVCLHTEVLCQTLEDMSKRRGTSVEKESLGGGQPDEERRRVVRITNRVPGGGAAMTPKNFDGYKFVVINTVEVHVCKHGFDLLKTVFDLPYGVALEVMEGEIGMPHQNALWVCPGRETTCLSSVRMAF